MENPTPQEMEEVLHSGSQGSLHEENFISHKVEEVPGSISVVSLSARYPTELTSDHAGIQTTMIEPVEVVILEPFVAPADEKNDIKAEVSELNVNLNEVLQCGTDACDGKTQSDHAEPSNFSWATDAEKTSNMTKENAKEREVDKSGKMKSVQKEAKVLCRRTKTRKNKTMRTIATSVLLEGNGGLSTNNRDGAKKKNMKKCASVSLGDDGEKAPSKGFLFICNARTRKDCFHYNIFGLPATRKEMVAKVYKGMKLFLYDVDRKQLHGIYRAAGPGGYNIEPNAFKSALPSQVRFTVSEECAPLQEEHFRDTIRSNYTRHGNLNCLLSGDQVHRLCKLCRGANRRIEKQKAEDLKREAFNSAKLNIEGGFGIQDRSERGWSRNCLDLRVHYQYGRETSAYPAPAPPPTHLPTSHFASPTSQPLPAYAYGGSRPVPPPPYVLTSHFATPAPQPLSACDYNGVQVPVAGYAHGPYGYYWGAEKLHDQLYDPSFSAGHYDPLRLRQRY